MYTAFICFLKILFVEIIFVSTLSLGVICTKSEGRTLGDGTILRAGIVWEGVRGKSVAGG